jgi:diguanylate cyclase (GGDEF)-like protein
VGRHRPSGSTRRLLGLPALCPDVTDDRGVLNPGARRTTTTLMSRTFRLQLAFVAAALAIGGAVGLTATAQRATATARAHRLADAQRLEDTTLYQELEVGLSNESPEHRLEEFLTKEAEYGVVRTRVRADGHGDRAVLRAVGRTDRLHQRWLSLARRAFSARTPDGEQTDQRHDLIEQLGDAVIGLRTAIGARQDADQRLLEWIVVLLSAGVTLIAGGVGGFVAGRRERRGVARDQRDRRYRETQAEFAATMQIVHDEPEAHGLVRRHLERTLAESAVVVLNRNNSANRLEAATPLAEDSHLARALADGVEPRACVAARLGRTHEGDPADSALLCCELCGKTANSTCTPLLVSGEVIGSVLVEHPAPLDATDRERVTETVAQASPVIGNLRNLAIAELHAATDSLTGLPNRRALHDALRRMVAQAGRSLAPLAAVALDLDHFKQINDRFGHEKGDDVLAAVGRLRADAVRDSDVAARAGGEEFCILLPDTDLDGALAVAEKLRSAIARLEVPGVDTTITGSFGVASFPLHAMDTPTLLRKSDRALYVAKQHGRDRVEAATVHGTEAAPLTEGTPRA